MQPQCMLSNRWSELLRMYHSLQLNASTYRDYVVHWTRQSESSCLYIHCIWFYVCIYWVYIFVHFVYVCILCVDACIYFIQICLHCGTANRSVTVSTIWIQPISTLWCIYTAFTSVSIVNTSVYPLVWSLSPLHQSTRIHFMFVCNHHVTRVYYTDSLYSQGVEWSMSFIDPTATTPHSSAHTLQYAEYMAFFWCRSV